MRKLPQQQRNDVSVLAVLSGLLCWLLNCIYAAVTLRSLASQKEVAMKAESITA